MSEQTDKESPEEFRAAFKEVLQAYRVTLNMLVENFPRTVTSQALSQSLSITNKRNTSPLPQSMKEDLIDGLIAVIGKDALKKRVSYSNESEEYIFSYAKAYYSRLEHIMFINLWFSIAYKEAFILAIILCILICKPRGLFSLNFRKI